MALEPVIHEPDGSTHVLPRAQLVDVTFNGVSVLTNRPIEIQVWPGGWGFVCVQLQIVPTTPPTAIGYGAPGPGKVQIDGQNRNYTYWGQIGLVTP